MPDLGEMQKELAALRAARDAAAFDARTLALRTESLKTRRAELARVARGDDNAASQVATVDREIATLQSALTENAQASSICARAWKEARHIWRPVLWMI